jgi:hypothetical protein
VVARHLQYNLQVNAVVPKSYCGNFSLASGFISLHLFSLLSKFIEFRQLPHELSPHLLEIYPGFSVAINLGRASIYQYTSEEESDTEFDSKLLSIYPV